MRRAPGREGALELALVVGLDERLEAEVERGGDEAGQPAGRVEHGEQEDDVRAGRPQERQLARVDDELLGQDREGHRRADGPQVLDRAAEPVRLAEHRDRRRPAGRVRAGPGDGIVVGGGDRAPPTARSA